MTLTLRVVLAMTLFLLITIPVFADIGDPLSADPFTITFDENGNATSCVFGGGCSAAPEHVGVDPNLGLTTLIYQLPTTIGPGPAGIQEFGGTSIGDGLDFFNASGNGFMAYYSDKTQGNELADTVTPAQLNAIFSGFVGATEDASGNFDFVAGTGDPSTTNFYKGASPEAAVPESGSLGLLASVIIILGGSWRRFHRA